MIFKRVVLVGSLLLLGAIVLLLSLYIALPVIVEGELKKRIRLPAGVPSLDFDIIKTGISNTCITDIKISQAIHIDKVNVSYDIKWPVGVKIKQLILTGVILHGEIDDNGTIKLKELSLPPKDGEKHSDAAILKLLPYLPEKITIENSVVWVEHGLQSLRMPVSAVLKVDAANRDIVSRIRVDLAGAPVNVALLWNFEREKGQVEVSSKSLDINQMLTLAAPEKGKLPSGMRLEDINTLAVLDKDGSDFKASFQAVVPGNRQIPVVLQGKTVWEKGLSFDIQVATQEIRNINFQKKERSGTLLSPWIKFSLKGDLKALEIDGSAGIKSCEMEQNGLHFSGHQATLSWQAWLNTQKSEHLYQARFNTKVKQIRLSAGQMTASVPQFSSRGHLTLGRDLRPAVRIFSEFEKGRLENLEKRIVASGIKLHLPVSYPFETKTGTGSVSVAKASWQGRSISMDCDVQQTGPLELGLKGKIFSDRIENLEILWSGYIRPGKSVFAQLDFVMPEFHVSETTLQSMAVGLPDNMTLEADVALQGRVTASKRELFSEMKVDLNGGSVSIKDSDFHVQGIETHIEFEDLFDLRSHPGQHANIDRVAVKDILLENAKIRFSIENKQSFLIENIRFNWCGGLVTTEAIRFPQKDQNYALSLYCDRLQMASLLQQVGAFEAQGSGTLNGRIPVVYKKGEISFDNGFLFSTPGSGGRIMVKEADVLTAGIPLDSPQFSELDLAREALRDFDYQWAKLMFNTDRDTLHVKMEMDGKPSRILPFEYKKEAGRFVRVGAASPGSDFQGIKLDVNLNLPFNRVMKFGNKMKSVLE